MITEICCENWKEFEKNAQLHIEENDYIAIESPRLIISGGLFRGQADADWHLQTTLERFFCLNSQKGTFPARGYAVNEYNSRAMAIHRAFVSQSRRQIVPKIVDESDFVGEFYEKSNLPNYDFLVYLRHIGFPSPLLDWTRSFYVAAYFAFKDARPDKNVAIYFYRESVGSRHHEIDRKSIVSFGPFVVTHRRHYIQQCEYTACLRVSRVNNDSAAGGPLFRYYEKHKDGNFSNDPNRSNFLIKYVIPGKERKSVMKTLDQMNINEFSLFGNEEGLADHLANTVLINDIIASDRD